MALSKKKKGRPPGPSWRRRIPRIIAALEVAEETVIDSSEIRKAFGLKDRAAQLLMKRIGAQKRPTGILLVSRDRALLYVRAVQRGLPYLRDVERRRTLADVLQEEKLGVKARAVKYRIDAPRAQERTIEGLPDTIRIAPGELRVRCTDARDLFRQLYELSRAIAQNYDRFEGLVGSP